MPQITPYSPIGMAQQEMQQIKKKKKKEWQARLHNNTTQDNASINTLPICMAQQETQQQVKQEWLARLHNNTTKNASNNAFITYRYGRTEHHTQDKPLHSSLQSG